MMILTLLTLQRICEAVLKPYQILLHWPGKMLFGMRVVRVDGEALSVPRALGRYLAEMLSAAALGAGYLITPFHPERRALHDLVAGTRVIRRSIGPAVIQDKA